MKGIAKILSTCGLGRFARRGRSFGVRSWELRRDDAVRNLALRANN